MDELVKEELLTRQKSFRYSNIGLPTATYRECRSDGPLLPFVEACWQVTSTGRVRHLVVPDGCIDFVFSRSMGLQVVGAMTRWSDVVLAPGDWVVGVRFRPGAARPFLHAPPGEFTDRQLPLEDVWGRAGRALQERVGNAPTRSDALSLLAGQLRESSLPALPVAPAVRALVAPAGTISVESAARHASLSVRQLRRVCVEETGLTPKQLSRVLRFRRASRLIAGGQLRGGANVAAECGYYDQAHLIRDFQLLTGRTPSAYLAVAVFSNP